MHLLRDVKEQLISGEGRGGEEVTPPLWTSARVFQ